MGVEDPVGGTDILVSVTRRAPAVFRFLLECVSEACAVLCKARGCPGDTSTVDRELRVGLETAKSSLSTELRAGVGIPLPLK